MCIMKNIVLLVMMMFALGACDDFLDSDNLMKKDTSNFPTTPTDAEQALTACYSCVQLPMRDAGQSSFVISEILSDDRLGGGGDDDRRAQAINQFRKVGDNMLGDIWVVNFAGIFRCNMFLETIDNVTGWNDDAQKKRMLGEVYFLRAYFYYELCRVYGSAPLILTTEAVNLPRASADELYAQIASDLKMAISLLPSVSIASSPEFELGHATKWAAEALMGRVFLFYTGYYQKDALPLPESSTVTKNEVINWLEDCIAQSGHALLPDFRSLWPYCNELTAPDYKYASDNNLTWIGEMGKNKENVFSIKSSSNAGWDTPQYSNHVCLFFAFRGQDYWNTFPFGEGYGFAPISSFVWDEWQNAEPKDIRRSASIIDVNSPDEGIDFTWNGDRQMEETGYWQKKYIAINAKQGDLLANYSYFMFNGSTEISLNNTQDLYLIRYADVLLMASELKKDATYLNEVRGRAGLDPVAYSEAAVRNERRWELAFEGGRYYDLLRWGIAAEKLSKQNGIEVTSLGAKTKMKMGDIVGRLKETGGFMPIPQTEIDLSNGVLVQTPGWSGSEILY